MIKYGLLLLIGCSLAAAFHPRLDGRIVGGQNADIRDFPHQVSFRYFGGHICGGSIIGKRWILTAAHCTRGKSAQYISFLAGSTDRRDDNQGVVVQAKKIYDYPEYNPSNYDNDFSLIELMSDLPLGRSGIEAIALTKTEPKKGQKTTVTGWGALSSGGGSPNTLQKVDVDIIDRNECKADYNKAKISDAMICAAAFNKDSCQGDSGGPLIMKDGGKATLVGVVSWGYGCADPNYPGVYSNVVKARNWIYDVTQIS